jgi:hypothetical protein
MNDFRGSQLSKHEVNEYTSKGGTGSENDCDYRPIRSEKFAACEEITN